jgi:hypothetical protein
MEYHSALKRKDMLTLDTWMNFKNVMLSEIGQLRKADTL